MANHFQFQRHFSRLQQKLFDEAVGAEAMELPENSNKPLQRLSVPILREYLANEFASVMNPPFAGEKSFERLVDDIVFFTDLICGANNSNWFV